MATVNLQDNHVTLGDQSVLVADHNDALDEIQEAINTNDSIAQGLGNRVAVLEADGVPANEIIPAISKTYNLPTIQAVDVYTGEDSNGWELRTNLSYNLEAVPAGSYKGQFATVALAVAGGAAVADWYYDTATTYFYEITNAGSGTEAGDRIYRAGSSHLPLIRAVVVSGTGTSTRVIIFDLTNDDCSMWMEFLGVSNGSTSTNIVSGQTAVDIKFSGSKLALTSPGHGLLLIDFSKDIATRHRTSGTPVFNGQSPNNIALRNSLGVWIKSITDYIPGDTIYSIDSYTAPNAPIDQLTGMPVPLLGFTSDAGVVFLLEDGSVSNSSDTSAYKDGVFDKDGNFSCTAGTSIPRVYSLTPSIYRSDAFSITGFLLRETSDPAINAGSNSIVRAGEILASFSSYGIVLLQLNFETNANTMFAKIGTEFNSGWIVSPLCAALCDTATGDIDDTAFDVTNITRASLGAGSSYGSMGINEYFDQTNFVGTPYPDNSFMFTVGTGDADLAELASGAAILVTQGGVSAVYTIAGATNNYGRIIICGETGWPGAWNQALPLDSIKPMIADRKQEFFSGVYSTPNHLTVIGTLSRTAVVAGGIAALSGFTITDYLTTTDSALDLDAADYSLTIAFKFSATVAAQTLISTGTIGSTTERFLYITSNGKIEFYNGTTSLSSEGIYDDGEWHIATLSLTNTGAIIKIWVDTILLIDSSATMTLGAFTFADLRVGLRVNDLLPFEGSLAIMSIEDVALTAQQVFKKHTDGMRLLESGTVTVANTIDAAYHDEKNGVTLLLDNDDNELQLNGLVIESSRDLTASASTDVGAVADIARQGRAQIIGGSTDLLIEIESRDLREAAVKMHKERFTVKYTGDSSRVQFPLQTTAAEVAATAGAKPIRVIDNGSELTEGASDDWTVEFDGLGYWAELAVAPGVNDVLVEFETEAYR